MSYSNMSPEAAVWALYGEPEVEESAEVECRCGHRFELVLWPNGWAIEGVGMDGVFNHGDADEAIYEARCPKCGEQIGEDE